MPMTALMPTDYERGVRDPAEHIAPPIQPKGDVVDKMERARRAALLEEAIERLGNAAAVSRALGVADSTISSCRKGLKAVPHRYLDDLEAMLSEGDCHEA